MTTSTRLRTRMTRTAGRIGWSLAATACAGLLAAGAGAQDSPPAVHAGSSREAGRWDLPRIFYDARQRRSFDAQERAIRLGLSADGAGPGGPRFDGWLTGPTGTHAWVSGTRYIADRAGRLHPAEDHAAQGADAIEDGAARLDRSGGVLVMRRETEGTLQLRVGEADNPLDSAAPPSAVPAAR
jgi:hypothetical protein